MGADLVVAEQVARPVSGRRRDQVRATEDRLTRGPAGGEGDLAGTEIGSLKKPLFVVASAGSAAPYTFVFATADTDAGFFVIVK